MRTWRPVARAGAVTIYAVPDPVPIMPGAEVLALTHNSISFRVPRPGTYRLSIRRHGTFVAPAAATYSLRFP